jgi:hypothetical protein
MVAVPETGHRCGRQRAAADLRAPFGVWIAKNIATFTVRGVCFATLE